MIILPEEATVKTGRYGIEPRFYMRDSTWYIPEHWRDYLRYDSLYHFEMDMIKRQDISNFSVEL